MLSVSRVPGRWADRGAEGIVDLLRGEVCEIELRSSPWPPPGPCGPWRFSNEDGGKGRGEGPRPPCLPAFLGFLV